MEQILTFLPGLFVLFVFSIGAWLMITKKLPSLLTLPLVALIVLVAMVIYGNWGYYTGDLDQPRITYKIIMVNVIGDGVKSLHGSMILAFLGGILSFMMQKSGVAEQMIKNGAELIGDNPLGVGIFCMTLVGLMFTTIGGLGAVIMVSIVLLPLMATVGIPPLVAGGIMVIGISLGGTLNAGNWVLFVDGLKVPFETVKSFAIIVFIFVYAMGVCFISIEMWRLGALRSLAKMLTIVATTIAVALGLVWLIWIMRVGGEAADPNAPAPAWLTALRVIVGVGLAGVIGIILNDIRSRIRRWRHQIVTIKWYAYLIPVIPLLLIMLYGMDSNAAFVFGILYAMLATARPGSISFTIQSMIQGASAVMPAIILFMGIGLIINVFKGPSNWNAVENGAWPTIQALQPYFIGMQPTPVVFVVVFSIFAPFALYRGPLNTWGLGFGVANILTGTVGFSSPIIMGMLQMVGQIQGICDPTNTWNVWLANELRIDVQQLMIRTIPYVWVMAILGLVTCTFFFPVDMVSWKATLETAVEAAK
ncbi:MAG: hypothetical protein SFY68_14370 [Candidatus Sumerlaeia bacterium]|nr:hypothetical protein [Candidatus Sumerlaeia bacterium]